MVPPFVKVGDTWHLVVNWCPGMSASEWKLLRPLPAAEHKAVEQAWLHCGFETWALLVPDDQARTSGRS